jgi:diadenosine tetraphosphate (Ap4A) HIT family hydrolase
MTECVFCLRDSLEIIAENKLALAFYDTCPVSNGHSLVIPKRHVETFFDASPEEHMAISQLIIELKSLLDKNFSPDGYNIGANVGQAAGQTVFHFHVHVIPRYHGDVEDPRGGLRKVISSRNPHLKCSKNSLH